MRLARLGIIYLLFQCVSASWVKAPGGQGSNWIKKRKDVENHMGALLPVENAIGMTKQSVNQTQPSAVTPVVSLVDPDAKYEAPTTEDKPNALPIQRKLYSWALVLLAGFSIAGAAFSILQSCHCESKNKTGNKKDGLTIRGRFQPAPWITGKPRNNKKGKRRRGCNMGSLLEAKKANEKTSNSGKDKEVESSQRAQNTTVDVVILAALVVCKVGGVTAFYITEESHLEDTHFSVNPASILLVADLLGVLFTLATTLARRCFNSREDRGEPISLKSMGYWFVCSINSAVTWQLSLYLLDKMGLGVFALTQCMSVLWGAVLEWCISSSRLHVIQSLCAAASGACLAGLDPRMSVGMLSTVYWAVLSGALANATSVARENGKTPDVFSRLVMHLQGVVLNYIMFATGLNVNGRSYMYMIFNGWDICTFVLALSLALSALLSLHRRGDGAETILAGIAFTIIEATFVRKLPPPVIATAVATLSAGFVHVLISRSFESREKEDGWPITGKPSIAVFLQETNCDDIFHDLFPIRFFFLRDGRNSITQIRPDLCLWWHGEHAK
uniref:Uncharacterized protein n=1 Tax=Lotharella globosa TaxID=91324 RepID=A0A7S3ZCP8_9EUKA